MPSAVLENRGVIRVSGADAHDFLQGLVTNDMNRVAPGVASYAALLTPQGKIVSDFIVSAADDGFLIDCPRALAADLARRLRMYKLRAKIDVNDQSAARCVIAHWGESAAGAPDPRHAGLGSREWAARGVAASDAAALAAYEARRISLGVPEGGVDFAYGDAYPHEANMDLLNGVDFRKGCYVGQEVVSRVEHRGTARKRIVRVTFEGAPPVGALAMAGDTELGRLTSVAGEHGLATIRVDKAAEAIADGLAIHVDGRPAALALPGPRG